MRRSLAGSGLILIAALGTPALQGQAPDPKPLAFEVASVKENLSGRPGGSIRVPPVGGAVSFTNVMLRVLIREAYQVDPYTERFTFISGPYERIIGRADAGPQSDAPRFDVQGKPPANTRPADRRAMMRALLEDRFKLRVYRETREMPVYALTIVRAGRFGPNLAASKFDCDAYFKQGRAGGTAEEPMDTSGKSWCRYPLDRRRVGVENDMRMAGPVRLLIERTQPFVERPIVDATGLSENVEWTLTFGWGTNAPPDVPDLFTALQEQLGFKLESTKAPVEVLVVDHVEKPTPD
jgi:uncharacterized protein (TIGR03435 family)